jgi:ketose-bisphosphate aldolase
MHEQFAEHVRRARASATPLLAFNVVDLASLRAVLEGARTSDASVIVQFSSRTVKYYGARVLVTSTRALAADLGVTAFVHLDHCRDDEVLAEALRSGFDGIMADGSHLPIDENIQWTRAWRERSRHAKALLEAEFTGIKGEEDGIVGAHDHTSFSIDAYARFCTETEADFAGADIGTHHGHYAHAPEIDFALVRSASTSTLPAFVVHGGSGLPDSTLRQLARSGATKVNFSTDLKDAWLRGMRNPTQGEPLELIRDAAAEVERTVLSKFRAFSQESP